MNGGKSESMKPEKLREVLMVVREEMSENVVGKPIQVGERTLIPVVKISCFYGGGKAKGRAGSPRFGVFCVTPLAVVVVDPQGERVLPLSGEEVSLSELIVGVPGLAEKIKEAQEGR